MNDKKKTQPSLRLMVDYNYQEYSYKKRKRDKESSLL